jgi:hypothetical protein
MINSQFEKLITDPLNIIGDMSYNQYSDWLDLGTEADQKACLKKFQDSKMLDDYIEILKIKLKSFEVN